MAVPYTFGTATAAIPLSQLDSNFATAITIGNTAVQLGNTVTTLNNMTLANVTISSGTVTITNVAVTTANVSGTANISTLVVTANASVAGNVTVSGNTVVTGNVTSATHILTGGTANGVVYLDTTKTLTTGSALVFDGSNLGLGVTPSAWGTASGQKAFQIGTSGFALSSSGAGSGDGSLTWNGYYNGTNWIYSYTGGAASRFRLNEAGAAWFIAPSGTAGNVISFRTSLTLSGNISGSNVYPSLQVNSGTATELSTAKIQTIKQDNNTTTSNIFVQFLINDGANGCGQITANGANTAAFGSYSDERLKENVVDLEPQLANIMSLRAVEFDYIESEGGGHQVGFIAQNMEQIYPDVVGEREDGMKMIAGWSKTEARLVKAIQEMKAIIDTQSLTITQLQADVAALKGA